MIAGRTLAKNNKSREFLIDVEGAKLAGTLVLPCGARGLVLFAHGSGSGRHSPRNRYVAQVLQSHGIGTVLFDLLTHEEESLDRSSGEFRFNIPFLAKRLVGATHCALNTPDVSDLKIGYFGASTGAGAAVMAAAELPGVVAAVVSRGGRPDLAGATLRSVRAPTLLIVGSEDKPVIGMNKKALAELGCAEKKLILVPGATHLFEEPGTLERAANLAADWFASHLSVAAKPHAQTASKV
jgi:putative phosphoribosyl transferase